MPRFPDLSSSGLSPAQGRTLARQGFASLMGKAQQGVGDVAAVLDLRQGAGAGTSDTRGGVAIMTALLAAGLIGVSALAVDVGTWEVNKSGLQGAADQAVLAAGLAARSGHLVMEREVRGFAAAHGFVHGRDGVTVVMNRGPRTGRYAGDPNAIEVIITQQQKSFLSGVVENFSAPVASAKAVIVPAETKTCVVALSTSGTGIKGDNSAAINSAGCDVYVNSTSKCNVSLSNTAKINAANVVLRTTETCISNQGEIKSSETTQTNAGEAADPYRKRMMPTPLLKCDNIPSGRRDITLTPGTYCKLDIDNGRRITLEPGVYIIDGGGAKLSNNSSIVGTNVTLVFTGSLGSSYAGPTLDNNSTITLTPPTTGETRGIALWIDKREKPQVEFSNNSSLNVTGAVYAPGSHVKWSNSGGSTSRCLQLIASTIEMSNASTFRHECTGVGVENVPSDNRYTLKE